MCHIGTHTSRIRPYPRVIAYSVSDRSGAHAKPLTTPQRRSPMPGNYRDEQYIARVIAATLDELDRNERRQQPRHRRPTNYSKPPRSRQSPSNPQQRRNHPPTSNRQPPASLVRDHNSIVHPDTRDM